ncbi:processive 1,2-diacylglycerol beta-glucosyltransferase [Melghirimyces profundicolus]|uniref:Processive 1,2-diacylglycerol beta-glucosyltransferase n=1 Tax=Melghirimyces profundicolus TaxID=1242148 RepID=A0A2T6BXG5_9BACL|nr:glycosyltransferase [Melghirimyces profundicolus]PTX60758.1 processive 1,2-diacylglycerol beta-glucosyltransferase [Melghirimyces profundicolus]
MINQTAWADGPVAVETGDGTQTENVLIVSENFGTGHTKAAEALEKGIRESNGQIGVHTVELGRELRPQVHRALLASYLGMIQKVPGLWKKVYGQHHSRAFPRWVEWCLYQALYSSLADYLMRYRPRLVVSTHPFASSGVARLIREGFPVSLCTLITDFSAHGSWIHPETERYLVTHAGVKDQLERMGVEGDRIFITGIPTDPRFWESQSREEVRKRMGLADMPTVLILGGGLGIGRTDRLVRAAAKWKDRMQVLVCTGHNRRLKETLEKEEGMNHPHIRITGYTHRMADWMDAADLIVSKPGGMTCSEAIAKGKPLLIYGAIPGHEENNSRFMVEQGLAEAAVDDADLDLWFRRLLSKDPCLDRLRERMLNWRHHIHPSHSVNAVLNLLTS